MEIRFFFSLFLFVFAVEANAAAIVVDNELPQGGAKLGDLWRFVCPPGGHFDLTIDGISGQIDPEFWVIDKKGAFVAGGDNNIPCTVSACNGGSCPQVIAVPCAAGGGVHYIQSYNRLCLH